MSSKTALVVTSISQPNKALTLFAEGSRKNKVHFIVIGDTKSPSDFSLQGCEYWSIKRQQEMPFRVAELLPKGHYARKNLGYLRAIQEGASIIVETDDDNLPRDEFWSERNLLHQAKKINNSGWVNVYRYFTDALIWPRGFPLELVQQSAPSLPKHSESGICCPIQQGLADENPDVDAVYRLVYPLPQSFACGHEIAIGSNTWTPFNSQNTTWHHQAFPLLYLPSYCSFRMTDIWRSFVAQRICWENEWYILFHGPTVWQERNEHNLLKDFADEVSGYTNNARICAALAGLELTPGPEYLGKNLLACYECLISLDVVGSKELPLVRAWIDDFSDLYTNKRDSL